MNVRFFLDFVQLSSYLKANGSDKEKLKSWFHMRFSKYLKALYFFSIVTTLNLFGEYPDRPIYITVPFSSKSGGARATVTALAPLVSKELGVPVIPQFVGGDQTNLGYNLMAEAAPDGYQLGLMSSSLLGRKKESIGEIGISDLTLICQVNSDPGAFFLKNGLKINNFNEFIAYIKENPGKLKGASGIRGGFSHLAFIGTFLSLGLDPNKSVDWVLTKDVDKALEALKTGDVDFISLTIGEGIVLVKTGDAKVIVLLAKQRSEQFPDVPTLKELTGSDFTLDIWRGIVGPKNLPEPVVKKLEAAFAKVCQSPEGMEALKKENVTPSFLNQAQLKEKIKKEEPIVIHLLKIMESISN